MVLSRTIDAWNEVELWRTPDGGRTWLTPIAVTRGSDAHNFRPTIPRDLTGTSSVVVFYVHGTATSFRSFRTVVRMHVVRPSRQGGGLRMPAAAPAETTER